jgi:hypothetical protein
MLHKKHHHLHPSASFCILILIIIMMKLPCVAQEASEEALIIIT